MPKTVTFFVPGLPIAKGRARTATRKKKDGTTFIAHITPDRTLHYEGEVRRLGKAAFARPFEGPIELRAVFEFPVPESSSKNRKADLYGTYRAMGSDLDNLCKAVLDGLNRRPLRRGREVVGWDHVAWLDDSQVVRLLAAKKFVAGPLSPAGVSITVTQIEIQPAQASLL